MTRSNNREHRRVFLIMSFLIGGGLLLWWIGRGADDNQFSPDPQVAELQRGMLHAKAGEWGPLKQRYLQLSPAQQRDFDNRKKNVSPIDHERQLRQFFNQTRADQREQIDREITGILAKRQETARQSDQNGPARGASTPSKAGGRTPSQVMAAKQAWNANASPELRSMMTRRIQMLNQRMRERGIEPL